MEKKIDEAAVWQRVSGASAEGMQSSSPPVLVLPELMELLSDMERCSALLSRMTRSGVRGSAPLQQTQRQQVTLMRGITCLLSGTPQAPGISSLPGGTLSGQLIWLLESMERTADRLDAIAPRTSGLVRSLLLDGPAAAAELEPCHRPAGFCTGGIAPNAPFHSLCALSVKIFCFLMVLVLQ